MKTINKNSHLKNDDFTLNVNNSNDFNRILGEIKLKQLQYEKEKTKKNPKSKIETKNENKIGSHKKELEKNTMEYKKILRKNRNNHEKYSRKHKSEEKIKKEIFEDTPIFPHIKSLILDHESESRNSEYSYDMKNAKDEKIKNNNSLNKNGNHTIYDIYTNTLKKLSIKDENNFLKGKKKGNLYINDKILENKKKNLYGGIKNKKNMNLINANISNSYDTSSYSIIQRSESNNSKKRERVNDQKQKEAKQKKSYQENHCLHINNRNYNDIENINNNYATNNQTYYDNRLADNCNIIKENHNYSSDKCYEDENTKGRKKEKLEKEQDEYKYEYEEKNKGKYQDNNEDYYINEESYENSIEMEKSHKSNTNESISLKNENFLLKDKENPKKKQKMHIENSSKYNETEKASDYLKTPFMLSIECLDENEKQLINKREIKNEDMEIINLNHGNDILSNCMDTYHKNNSILAPVKKRPINNMNYLLNDQAYDKKKLLNEKKIRNYSKSEVTTTDSEYSFNENLNISYENFKTKNKNKMFSVVDERKNKKDLLKIINSKNILNIRKILRIMRELYIGFIGLQLIYFITYILFGNNSVYLIQIISISCTFFSLLDANYHGYILNGFIDICIAIFLNIAIIKDTSGFKSLQTDNVLKNIATSNVILLYMFSVFSFVNSYYIFRLHSLEKQSIKHIIRNIESRKEKEIKVIT
ncbi:conserved Plasmodium protein, unknown function [Plasmodium relictum]|uniref:Basal complex transmembrane protein 1 n=1 Tax=Plasmodium relictum TaxID=85471 RepID=A0A1J1H7Y4_PLARL|nr:conserved Plasmodium protein, unknown function [Plasmodium relictum]CRH01019.1 conserved Plasmodium protein, unknown function [Plasmodium relictum]